MMRKLLWIPLCAITLLVPVAVLAGGSSGGFNSVVNSIEGRYHVHATRVPLLGLISLVARGASHGVAANLHVAEFENFNVPVDGSELDALVTSKLGPEWQLVIRETSRRGQGEQSLIFMRPEGARMGMFIVDHDGNDLDVVQLSVDPDHLEDSITRYTHHSNSENDDDSQN
ncbi:MAG: hypothetical protein P4L40_22965 [Terracidiphilus sp.]|nr:hypothetical protein [Terracidiphilus sp.]